MMDGAIASDVTITWLGALGVFLYVRFLQRRGESGPAVRATQFLLGTLVAMLFVRGFYWIHGTPWLGKMVFAAATLLPLAMTLFAEHLLRRHHPRWLKLIALSATVAFGIANLFADLPGDARWLLAFLASLLLVMLANAALLLRATGLSANERRLCRAVVAAALLCAVLAITDFRGQVPHVPLRLGAIGPLVLVCVLLNRSERSRASRILGPLFFAAVLAGAFTLAAHGIGPDFGDAWIRVYPVALAWILLTVVLVHIRTLSAAHPGNVFLSWLQQADLAGADAFLASLRRFRQTEEHLVLGPDELAGYAVDAWFDAAGDRSGPLALADVRGWYRGGRELDVAEQLEDLFARHEMTHALLVSRAPPRVVLLNLPHGADAALGQLRAGVIQRLARRLAESDAGHA